VKEMITIHITVMGNNQGYQLYGSGLETEFCHQPDLVQIQEPLDSQAPLILLADYI
jgi:hypothetical protein